MAQEWLGEYRLQVREACLYLLNLVRLSLEMHGTRLALTEWITGRPQKFIEWLTTIRGAFMANGLEKYLTDLAARLDATEVKAGFIDGTTYPDGTSVAEVAYKNEYGVPENNQPPRPFFRNAINSNKEEWVRGISRGLASGVSSRDVLEVIGARMKGDIQTSISELVDPPLSPTTLKIRRIRKVMPNSSNKPLVDTRVMIGDVNYEVIDDQS